MKMEQEISETMLAPCGMNCQVCHGHLKKKKACRGCRNSDEGKPEHCRKCDIKDCAVSHDVNFCLDCPSFPCKIIKRLDRSYRQRYQVSLIDNAVRLKTVGAERYLSEEREKWMCADCGGVVSLHDQVCSECGKER